jgi:hypothetical protein
MARVKVSIGDEVRIPLPNGRFAYGRVLQDASIAIYRQTTDDPDSQPPDKSYGFVVGVYEEVLRSGMWPVVGHVDFADPEDAWPPPHFMRDVISGRMSIYHRGHVRPASPDECRGLEQAAVWDRDQIVRRIMEIG